jgi:hypothetical protein
MLKANARRLLFAIVVTCLVLFLVYAPIVPVDTVTISGKQAELVCAVWRVPCPQSSTFVAHGSDIYESVTYLAFRFETAPSIHYPLKLNVTATNVSTGESHQAQVTLYNSTFACATWDNGVIYCATNT